MNKFSLRYEDVETTSPTGKALAPPKSILTPSIKAAQQANSYNVPNPPPLVNHQLFSTNPAPPSAFLMAAAAAGVS